MNFLSHYYFERYALDSHQVFGGLLPDLLKNVDKTYNIQIQKFEDQLGFHPQAIAITKGWKRHVDVDKIFHSSDFFYTHTHELRKNIEYIVQDIPVRSSFLAHIALELLLDHILIEKQQLSVARMYEHLEHIDKALVRNYLSVFIMVDEERFFRFYDRFVESKYIFEYQKIENIPHALYNICKRIWTFEVSSYHLEELAQQLNNYKVKYLDKYQDIYMDIQQKLDKIIKKLTLSIYEESTFS